jgi:hypothetical protein
LKRNIFLPIILGSIIIALFVLSRPTQLVAAQTCYDAAGRPVACPPGGQPKPTKPPREFPTRVPTLPPTLAPIASVVPSAVPVNTIVPNANGLGKQSSGFPWLFGLLLPAVLLALGWFFLTRKGKGGAPGSDKMGAQPHMMPPGPPVDIMSPPGPPTMPGTDASSKFVKMEDDAASKFVKWENPGGKSGGV